MHLSFVFFRSILCATFPIFTDPPRISLSACNPPLHLSPLLYTYSTDSSLHSSYPTVSSDHFLLLCVFLSNVVHFVSFCKFIYKQFTRCPTHLLKIPRSLLQPHHLVNPHLTQHHLRLPLCPKPAPLPPTTSDTSWSTKLHTPPQVPSSVASEVLHLFGNLNAEPTPQPAS